MGACPGPPHRTITNYETGEHEPGHKYLIEISKKFGVTVDYLVGRSDTPQPEIKKTSPYSEEAQELAKDYDGLDDHGKRLVRLIVDEEKDRCKKGAKKAAFIKMAEDRYDFEEEPDTQASSVKESGAV